MCRRIETADYQKINNYLIDNWGSDCIVTLGKIHKVEMLEGYITEDKNGITGICMYRNVNDELEIVLLEVYEKYKGLGTILLNKVIEQRTRDKRIWLVTTNDNVDAIRFYQKRGFVIKSIHINSIENERKLKPEIPKIGNYGIYIRDEIEMEYRG
jgi:ribosomal protein S18 acetylase RimI-like enzyme